MARGRMIDKRVSNSKKLGKISDKAARIYFMLYPHLDSAGRIAFDDLDDLKIEIIPYLPWKLKKIASALNELTDIELITLYPFNKKIAMQFERFEDFQTIRKDREAPSKIKLPRGRREDSGVYRITPALSLSLSLSLRKEVKKKKEIFFDYEKKKFFNIDIEDMAGWKDAYPAVDVDQQLKEMREWLLADPSREKSNYKKFINNWLSSEQSKAAGKPSYQDKRKKELDDWEKKPIED